MKYTETDYVRRDWAVVPSEKSKRLYASVRPSGTISIGGRTHERMGSPEGYVLLYDRRTRTIGLKAADEGSDREIAWRACRSSRSLNTRLIHARSMLLRFGILPERIMIFRNCEIDRNGVLVLSLKDATSRGERAVTSEG